MTLFDLTLGRGQRSAFTPSPGDTALLFVFRGSLLAQGHAHVGEKEVAIFEQGRGAIALEAQQDAKVLVLLGQPLNEPVVARGPFVMNTPQEIAQAMADYRQGKMGTLRPQG